MLATGDGAIPKAGNKGVAGSSGATKPSSQRKAPGNCLVLKPERARAEQSEQHGRRGAWRHGAERVLVPANFRSAVAGSSCGCTASNVKSDFGLGRSQLLSDALRRRAGRGVQLRLVAIHCLRILTFAMCGPR